jgi:hypothetical protein
MERIFSVSQDAHVLHIAGTLCLFVFSLAGLIGTGSSSSVKRQLAITLFILSLCTWLVDGWGLPPLIRSLCKVNYCQAPLRLASSWALNQSIFFKGNWKLSCSVLVYRFVRKIFWLLKSYEGKGLEVTESESLSYQSCILICAKNILKSIPVQKNVDSLDSKS